VASGDNGSMSLTADWRAGWAGRAERVAAGRYGLAATAGLLGLASVIEALARAAVAADSTSATAPQNQGAQLFALGLLYCVLGLATTLPLAFLRPAPAAVILSAATLLSLGAFHFLTAAGAAAEVIAVYRFGRGGSGRGRDAGSGRGGDAQYAALGLTVPFLVLALVAGARAGSDTRVLTVVLAALVPAAAWAGVARRSRAEALLHTAAAQVIAGTLVEHTARGERARIARELHDVVAHHISMIAIQAETARLTTPGMPAAGAQRLSEIGDTARAGLTEMRRLLGVLREDSPSPGEGADRHPQPGLEQLPWLVDEARVSSGAGCRLIISGPPATIDPGVSLAAYRIAQEALTNARRHAPGAAVDVELRYGDGELRLLIRDNGPGPGQTPPAGGHGLTGMRERATAVGGELRAGAATVGGFLVEARLPGKCETGR
jgi:signal transduction histidine kinase